MSSRRRAVVLLLVASAIAVISVGTFLLTPAAVGSFGWFAYAPVSGDVFGHMLFLDVTPRWAFVVAVASLIAAGWAAGFLAGRRPT